MDEYGIDYGMPVSENNSVGINVPESNFIISPEQLASRNPSCNDGNFGVNHFMYVLDFLARM